MRGRNAPEAVEVESKREADARQEETKTANKRREEAARARVL